ncbi:O-acetyl-ADP-ribose deacetylase [Candidatus Bathyarchaeota archaeon]|nr:O-acetyl-ADP-ribose deacetylase [Candidatus Bathyarchaeota archaeon]
MRARINATVFKLVKGDITEQDTVAIVNAANKRLAPGGGVAGAIHRAAGPGLWMECRKLGGCETGEAKLTGGYRLKAEYVIHTVGPVYRRSSRDREYLAACYRNSLRLAQDNDISSISFPAISTGIFGYPLEEAAKVAIETITTVLEDLNLSEVRLVLYSDESLRIHEKVFKEYMKSINQPLF